MTPAWAATRFVPKDFTDSSKVGGLLTTLAYGSMIIVFFCELGAFMRSGELTTMMLESDADHTLDVEFEIDMLDIECRNIKIVLYSQVNDEPVPFSADGVSFRALDQKGRSQGKVWRYDELADMDGDADHEKLMQRLRVEDGASELDSDWSSSHDGFKHKSFEHVIQSHDFTFINFFAGWCSHCQKFTPQWLEMASEIHGDGDKPGMTFLDRENQQRSVRMIKMNCVDFGNLCMEKGIDAYPSLRLYKGDGTFAVFEGRRTKSEIMRWLERTIKMKSYGWGDHHEAFERGCSVRGTLTVPRLPGRLEMMAGGGDQALNPAMTNVSHVIRRLEIRSTPTLKSRAHFIMGVRSYPEHLRRHARPLDGRTFTTRNFHEAWIHELKAVRSSYSKDPGTGLFMLQHQHHLSTLSNLTTVPQAKIFFDFEPYWIHIGKQSRPWYDFVTSMMAMLGGIYATMRLMSTVSLGLISSFTKSGGRMVAGLSVGSYD
eukprot:TRINITY_DN48126_c0_g1_i1.p1 TRINITY_DN48126_c0_g1~~TRINITY_DN48126_c0_g1_i1.p1  ORF type:complete len:499 (-),score=94.27 TRINITY_DN48126_c0_g1_i1:48-1505(-)